jgi:hypothetical protein
MEVPHPMSDQPSLLAPDFLPRQCTFAPEDWRILARHWFPIARAQDIGSQPVPLVLLDLELVVYRTPEGIHVGTRSVPASWRAAEHGACGRG